MKNGPELRCARLTAGDQLIDSLLAHVSGNGARRQPLRGRERCSGGSHRGPIATGSVLQRGSGRCPFDGNSDIRSLGTMLLLEHANRVFR